MSTAGALVVLTVSGVSIHPSTPFHHFAQKPHKAIYPMGRFPKTKMHSFEFCPNNTANRQSGSSSVPRELWLYRPFSVILIQRYLMNPLLTAQGSGPEKKLLFFWILSIMGRNILSVTSPFNTPPPSSRRQSYASNFLINIAQNNLPQTIYELSPNYVIINNVAFNTIAP